MTKVMIKMWVKLFKNKEAKKRLERWIGRQWVNLIIIATNFLTLNRCRKLGRILGKTAFYLVPRHRRQAIRNIEMIYGNELSKKQLREMIRRTFIHASCFGWETLYLYANDYAGHQTEDVIKNVEGLEYLQKAIARGKGVIGIGAHLGNFTILGRKLDSLGFANTAIMRQMRDGKLEQIFMAMRARFGQRSIPKFPLSAAIKASIDWLREGKILIIYIDQRSGSGTTVNFMGLPTPTPTGAAVFALKTGAAVLPIVNVGDGNGFYKLIIGEEVPIVKTGNQKKDIFVNTENFNKAIEKYIRLYPDQWFWFHNRWKGVRR